MERKEKRTAELGLILAVMMLICGCGESGKEDPSGTNNVTAIVDVTVIPMTDEVLLSNQTVLIEDGQVIQIGSVDQVSVPNNAQLIDGSGRYLLPGLADMHMHTREDWEQTDLWPVHPLDLYLANGVTTVRDFAPTGSILTYALDWREEIRAGLRDGPQILTSGKLLYASPLEDPEGIVQMNVDLGFDFIKFYSYLSEEDFRRSIQQANQLGIYTAGHIPFSVGLDGVLEYGMDEIAHVEELIYEFIDFDRQQDLTPDEWMQEVRSGAFQTFDIEDASFLEHFFQANEANLADIGSKLLKSDVVVDTTLVIDQVVVLKNFQEEEFLARPENRYLEAGYLDAYLAGDEKHLNQCRGVEAFCAAKAEIDNWIFRGLDQAGVLIVLGTDAGTGGMGIVPGFSVHDELEILVENGMSTYQALRCATANAGIVAEKMVGAGDFGTIEIGKRADLILVENNPLLDLSILRAPEGVMASGKWYSSEDLQQLLVIND